MDWWTWASYAVVAVVAVVVWQAVAAWLAPESGTLGSSGSVSGKREVRIIGSGSCLPGEPLPNDVVLQMCNLGTTEEWIESRIGIKTRHSSRRRPIIHNFGPEEGQANSDLCTAAARDALRCANLEPKDLDLIIVATCTPDYPVPSTATIVQQKLGIVECSAMDIRSACCGSMQALITATQYLLNGMYKTAVVIGCDVGSIFGNLDKDDPTFSRQDLVNAVMIGDAAAAVILRRFDIDQGEEPHGVELVYYNMRSIGGATPQFGMYLPVGGSVLPATSENLAKGLQFFKHDYKLVLEHGPELYLRALDDLLRGSNLTMADFDMFVPHQANGKIHEIAQSRNFPTDRLFHNFDRVGNTANASLLLAFDEIMSKALVPDGGYVAFGAAESTKWLYACLVVRWKNLKSAAAAAAAASASRSKSPFWMRLISARVIRLLQFGLKLQRTATTPRRSSTSRSSSSASS